MGTGATGAGTGPGKASGTPAIGANAEAGAPHSLPVGAPGAHSAVASGAAATATAEHNAMPVAHNPAQETRVLMLNRSVNFIGVDSF